MTLLYKSDPTRGREWRRLLAEKSPDLPFRMWPELGDPADVRYLAGWIIDAGLVQSLPNLEIVFSTGAGVDQIDLRAIPPAIPIVRMVEPAIAASMVEYVVMSVLALHRNLIDYIGQQRQKAWTQIQLQPASQRRVGVLGLGMLGEAAARKLAGFGFPVAGWSRSPRDLPGIECHSGQGALGRFLARTDILISLLPLTDETRGLLNAELFAALPAGAALLSCGRGAQLVQERSAGRPRQRADRCGRAGRDRARTPAARKPALVAPEGADHAAYRDHDLSGNCRGVRHREYPPASGRRTAAGPGRPSARLLTRGRPGTKEFGHPGRDPRRAPDGAQQNQADPARETASAPAGTRATGGR